MIDFIKMQATGNDYIYIDCFKKNIEYLECLEKLVIEMSNRNYGIGGDGVIFICSSKVADAKMIMYNKDGSEGLMCGNGIRCVSKYLYENITKKKDLTIETKSGIKEVKIINNDIIVNMGYPIFEPELIPINLDKLLKNKLLHNEREFVINCVSIGNPHCVIFDDNIDDLDIEMLSNKIQKSNIFQNQCNVNFVQILDKDKIKLRVYERGSGETLSCGTGACASSVIGIINGYLDGTNEIEVNLRGGNLYIKYNNNNILLRGSAEEVFRGKYLVKKH